MIPISKPWFTEDEKQAVIRPLDSGWVVQGPEVAAFEEEFRAFTGAECATAVSSGTTALHLALRAVGVGPNDEVITVSHSYIATANSVRYCDAVPVFVDIDPATFNMDPEKIASLITKRTKAILCVHQIGMPCDLARILAVAEEHHLPVIEDAACAAGSEIQSGGQWEKIGRPHGDVATFSFHPRKVLTTGDGGMLTTNNPLYDEKFKLWRQHAMNVAGADRHAAKEMVFEAYLELGYNYRMTDLQAAVGRVQLKKLPEMVARRRALAGHYAELLREIDGIGIPVEPEWARSNWQSYCIRLPVRFNQRDLMQFMREQGVSTKQGIMCAHREPAYIKEPWEGDSLKLSEAASDHGLILPLYHQLGENEQQQVVDALQAGLKAQGG